MSKPSVVNLSDVREAMMDVASVKARADNATREIFEWRRAQAAAKKRLHELMSGGDGFGWMREFDERQTKKDDGCRWLNGHPEKASP